MIIIYLQFLLLLVLELSKEAKNRMKLIMKELIPYYLNIQFEFGQEKIKI